MKPIDAKEQAMKVHEKDSVWYQETGEERCPKNNEWVIGHDGKPRQVGMDYRHCSEIILRPLPALTLPLRAGQRVICRDGVEVKINQVVNFADAGGRMLFKDTGLFCNNGDLMGLDAIADSPGWTAEEKPDEKKLLRLEVGKIYKTQAGLPAICEEKQDYPEFPFLVKHSCGRKGHAINGFFGDSPGEKQFNLISEWPDEKKEQAAAAVDVKAKASVISPANGPTPAAQPAILPTCACCLGAGLFKLDTIDGMLKAVPVFKTEPLKAYLNCPECHKPKPTTPAPVPRPDIPQPDCSSDSFVARRWRTMR